MKISVIIALYFIMVALGHFLYHERSHIVGKFLYIIRKIRAKLYYKKHGFDDKGVRKTGDYYEVDLYMTMLDFSKAMTNIFSLRLRARLWLNVYGYHLAIVGAFTSNVALMIESGFKLPLWSWISNIILLSFTMMWYLAFFEVKMDWHGLHIEKMNEAQARVMGTFVALILATGMTIASYVSLIGMPNKLTFYILTGFALLIIAGVPFQILGLRTPLDYLRRS